MPPRRGAPALRGPLRVLVVSSNTALAKLVQLTLDHGAYATRAASSVAEARAELAQWTPHLAIVEIELQDGDGLGLAGPGERGRPFIALTRRGDLKTKLRAFEAGVDDIVTVPFSPEELVARVLALMRRTYGEALPFIPVITIGGLKIDLLNQQVQSGTSTLQLTAIEQALLYLLASNAGQVLGREEILDALWGSDYIAESNLVDRHVRNLRVKLGDTWRHPRFIATVPGKGYRFLGT